MGQRMNTGKRISVASGALLNLQQSERAEEDYNRDGCRERENRQAGKAYMDLLAARWNPRHAYTTTVAFIARVR
jgi:hypothetical protein